MFVTQMERITERLAKVQIKNLSDEVLLAEVVTTGNVFVQQYATVKTNDLEEEQFILCLKLLKSSCARGSKFQNIIIDIPKLLSTLKSILLDEEANLDQYKSLKMNCMQLTANLCVQNEDIQKRVWNEMNSFILEKLRSPDSPYNNISAMITYNIFLSNNQDMMINSTMLLQYLLNNVSECSGSELKLNEFICIFLEHMITDYKDILETYKKLGDSERLTFLNYIIDFVKQTDTKIAIRRDLLKYLIFHFRRKSDCILKTVTSYVEGIDPKEIIALLEIISIVSAQEMYVDIFQNDGSLFLNIGCLLQSIQSIGQKSNNIFTPVQKIEYFTTTSNSAEAEEIEKSLSFSLKSLLVRTIANLSYKNKKNQELAREMEIMISILNCLNLDARNPLIKEWATLAIRNLCEDNIENQKLVASLSRSEDSNDGAKYEVHDDFILKTGSFSNKNL